jgi:glutaredoxin
VAITIYASTTCNRCEALAEFLEKQGIDFGKAYIDRDEKAMSRITMQNIASVPVIEMDGRFLKSREIFDNGIMNEKVVTSFVTSSLGI